MKKIIPVVSITALLAACGQSIANDPAALRGAEFTTDRNGVVIKLGFDADKMIAHGRVANSFTAPYTIDSGTIKFGVAASTMMMPFDPNVAKTESEFFKFISGGQPMEYKLTAATLTLRDFAGAEYVFKKIIENKQ